MPSRSDRSVAARPKPRRAQALSRRAHRGVQTGPGRPVLRESLPPRLEALSEVYCAGPRWADSVHAAG